MEQYKQLTLIIISIVTISVGISSQLWADRGEVSLEYKLKEGEQISENINMVFKRMPGEIKLTILCPTTHVVSDISEDGLIEMYLVYSPKVTEATVEGKSVPAENFGELTPLEVGRVKMRKDGHIVETTERLNLQDGILGFKKFFSPIGILPSKPVKIGNTWTQTLERSDIGKLEINFSFAAFETVQGYDCAKLEGKITGALRAPDNTDIQIKGGKYTAYFAIGEGLLINEKIFLDMNIPSEGNASLQSNYTVEFIRKEMLKPEQFKEKFAQLSLIAKAKDFFNKGDYVDTNRTYQKFLVDYPKSPWCDGARELLHKAAPLMRIESTSMTGGILPPEQAKTQGYITKWLVLGPLTDAGDAAISIEIDFLDSIGGEATVRPSVGDKFEYKGKTLTWQVRELPVSGNSLGQLDGFNVDYAVAYMVAYLRFEKSEEVDLWLGSNDSIAVWLNGKNVFRNPINRFWLQDADKITVKVNEGWNALMVKVGDTIGPWTMSARFPNTQILGTKFVCESQ